MDQLLNVTNLTFKYDDQSDETIKNISFDLSSGEILGILGPNGGGKTTLMKILSGLIKNYSGEIKYFGKRLDKDTFFTHLISYVPQSTNINTSFPLTAYEYLHYAGKSIGIKNTKEKILAYADKIGIANKLNYQLKDMSGGEKQRVFILKSILNDPKILLLDEPTKGLDMNGQDQLLSLIRTLSKNTSIIIVDHNINQIIRHSDKILCLNRTSHWHNKKEFLTQNVLETIYHCEFEHILIHENEGHKNISNSHEHQFCNHTDEHKHDQTKQFIWRKK